MINNLSYGRRFSFLVFAAFIISGFLPFTLLAQYIPENPQNTGIYSFIDELASTGVIDPNQTIKPWGKQQIAQWLGEAEKQKEKLTIRQQKELDFYLAGYGLYLRGNEHFRNNRIGLSKHPLGIYYRDSLFTLSIHPLLNGSLIINDSATIQNRWWGGSIYGTIGKHFSFYTSLTDHWETQVLGAPTYLTQNIGGKYKSAVDRIGGEYSTIRGGVTWGWKWGHIGMIYDRPVWGNGYNGTNILSGRNTPFAQLVLQLRPLKWFEFNYLHGWLNSEIVDSTRSFTSGYDYKVVYYEKYIAANMYTFKPWKWLKLSVGNSIIYSSPNAYPGFLIPTLFFRSVDENYSFIKSNSQLFFNLNLWPINHIHFYSSLYIDEFRLSRISDPNKYNFSSIKAGLRSTGWPLNNIIVTCEYTRTSPITYKHQMSVLSYATNNYTLGHYLRDNSEEMFASVEWKPLRGINLYVNYLNARHCNDYVYADELEAVKYPVLKDNIWKNSSVKGGLNYELFAGTVIKGSILFSNITSVAADGHTAQYWQNMFTPKFLQGKHVTLEGGFTIGF